MAEETPRLGIKKYDGTDNVKRLDFNNNYDIIDENSATKTEFDSHKADEVPHFKYDYKEELIYDNDGNLTKVEFYKDNILRKEEELLYDNGDLVEVNLKQYNENEELVYEHTETLSYDEGDLQGVERSVEVE